MKTIVYREFGGAAGLRTIEEAKPAIQPNHVLVKVKAVFPFSHSREAYEYAEKGSIIGKVVIALD